MRKKVGLTRLSFKKIRRTIFRNPLQFTAILLITILSTTLFSGLYGSVKQFENQINKSMRLSNTADITVNVLQQGKQSVIDADTKNIKEIVGDKGQIETKYTNFGKLNGFDNYIGFYDKYPTISKEFQIQIFNKDAGEDFFVIDWRYYYKDFTYGPGWRDEKGNPNPVNVFFDVAALRNDYKNGESSLFDSFVKPGKTNIFNDNFLKLSITPTARMKSFANISVADSSTPDSYLSKSLFNKILINTIKENFDIPDTPPQNPLLKGAYNLLKDPITYVTNKYYVTSDYSIKINNQNDVSKINKNIKTYFSNKRENNLISSLMLEETNVYKTIKADLNQTIILSLIFPALFMLVSLLVTGTTFAQLILKERNEIGTMKAVGVSNKRIIINYLLLGLIITIVGCFIGIALGPTLIPPLMDLKFDSLYWIPKRVFVYPTVAAISSCLIFITCISLVIFFVSRKEVKLPPSFTLRPVLPKSLKSSKKIKGKYVSLLNYLYSSNDFKNKEDINKFIKNGNIKINDEIIYDYKKKVNILNDVVTYKDIEIKYKKKDRFLSFKLAIRNIRCSIPKSLLVLIGIAGCTAIVGASFGIDNSLTRGAQSDLDRFLSSDLNLNFSSPSITTYNKIMELKDTTHEIEDGDAYSTIPTTIYKEEQKENPFETTVYAVNPDSNFIHFGGDLKLGDDRVIITKKLANKAGLGVGDKINFQSLGNEYKGTIYAVIDTFYIQGVFVANNDLYSSLGIYVTGAYIKVNKNIVKDTKEFGNKLLKIDGVINFYEYEKNRAALQSSFNTLTYITTIFKIFGVCLGLVVLYNFIILTYNQRSRDIATMKVVGFNNKKLSSTLLIEILILGVVGIILGTILAKPFLMLLLSINENDMLSFSPYISLNTYLYSILITLGAILIISLVVLIKNKRIKMVESLKSVE